MPPRFPGRTRPSREGSSFYELITALESRGETTDTTATEAETIVEELDELMPRLQDKREKDYCLHVLAKVCRKHVTIPKSYKISGVEQGELWKSGGVADIWTGKHRQGDVCIKVFRQHESESQQNIKGEFYYLAVRWKSFSHPNVLPFLGVSGPEIASPFGVVTPRTPRNIKEYTMERRGANRLLLLADVASGLKYLHLLDIVHGGVNPGNILITQKGTACIGDFGIAQIIGNPLVAIQSGTATRQHGGIRYMAPERLEKSVTGKESDVHSFAITAYEVLVEIEPYHEVIGAGPLGVEIMKGTRPPHPGNGATGRWLSDGIWGMLESCWTPEPSARPTIKEVHQVFRGSPLLRLFDLILPRIVGRMAVKQDTPKIVN